MPRRTRGPSPGGLTHADEVHGTDTGYMVSQLGSKNFESLRTVLA